MKNILIIGGTGFIGKNILDTLVPEDYNIFVLSRKSHPASLKHNKINFIEGSLADTDLVKNIISKYKIAVLLHLASNLIPSSNKRQFDEEMNNIILPTYELLNYIADKNIKIIYFSSGGAVYGKVEGKISEKNECDPINYHGFSKLIIEGYIKLLSKVNNLKYVILRPSNVYGKYQRLDSIQGFIAVALGKILSDQHIEIWGSGYAIRDYVNVSDIAASVKSILERNIENQTFNLGTGLGHSLLDVVRLIEEALKKSATITFKDRRDVDLDEMILDISSIESSIDYKPRNLQQGIKDFIDCI